MLATDVPLKGSELVGEEDNVPDGFLLVDLPFERNTPFEVCVLASDVLLKGSKLVGKEDNDPDKFLLVVSPFERNTPFFLSQQVCAMVPFPQQ